MWKDISVLALLFSAAKNSTTMAFSGAGNQITTTSFTVAKYPMDSTSKLRDSFNDNDEFEPQEKKKGFFANFFEELDAFVDDATSRRLGNGAQYYGKRKSSFYGKDDANRKRDKAVSDPLEDYRGPSNAGYFKWIPDEETGELKPVTRLREVNIEKKTRF